MRRTKLLRKFRPATEGTKKEKASKENGMRERKLSDNMASKIKKVIFLMKRRPLCL